MATSTVEFEEQLGDGDVDLLRKIVSAVQGLRYGSVIITVHDGHIVEFQRSEKFRVKNSNSKSS
jgi:hypothetical protein